MRSSPCPQPGPVIHITIPAERRVDRIPGVVIHRSTRVGRAVHPSLRPPRTRIEETVLDLVAQATTFDEAYGFVSLACQRRLTTPERIAVHMKLRKRLRWRAALMPALGLVRDGVHSPLEYRYATDVEEPHGLPKASRQVRVRRGARTAYLDVLYEELGLCVELDGKGAHPDDQRWLDIRRDNAAAAEGRATLRYGWADLVSRPCEVAGQVAAALAARGWTGQLRACGPGCRAREYQKIMEDLPRNSVANPP